MGDSPEAIGLAATSSQDALKVRAEAQSCVAGAGLQTGALVGQAAALLESRIGADRAQRDFLAGRALSVRGGELVVTASDAQSIGVLSRRYGVALGEISAELGLDLAWQAAAAVEMAVAGRAVELHSKGAKEADGGGQGSDGMGPADGFSERGGMKLDELIVGEHNRLAVDAARRVLGGQMPAGCSLYVHGGHGLGKTHILSSLQVEAMGSAHRNLRVKFVSAEQFANEYVWAVRHDKAEQFRSRYRTLDVLAIDDLQSLQTRGGTQQELVHTIDAIAARGGRVVASGSNHPRQLTGLGGPLSSRLLSGLVVQLRGPDEAASTKIVRSLGAKRGLSIDEGAARAVVQAAGLSTKPGQSVSVRELEGLVTRVEAVYRLLGLSVSGATAASASSGHIGMIVVQRALADMLPASHKPTGASAVMPTPVIGRIGYRPPVHLDNVVALVCERFGVTMSEVGGRGRHARVVLARAVATHLARKLTSASYPEIARALGRPNHSTVITAYERLKTQLRAGMKADLGDGRGETIVEQVIAELSAELSEDRAARFTYGR